MENLKKSWKTTLIGIIAIVGLCFKIYTGGGLSAEDFVYLIFAVGFLAAKDFDKSHTQK